MSAGAVEAAARRENARTPSRWVGGGVRGAGAVADDLGLHTCAAPRTPSSASPRAHLAAPARTRGRRARLGGRGTRCRHGARHCCARGGWAGPKGQAGSQVQCVRSRVPCVHRCRQCCGQVAGREMPRCGPSRLGRSSRGYLEHESGRRRHRACVKSGKGATNSLGLIAHLQQPHCTHAHRRRRRGPRAQPRRRGGSKTVRGTPRLQGAGERRSEGRARGQGSGGRHFPGREKG